MRVGIWLALGVLAAASVGVQPIFGCATCFGKSDAPMAQGMNMGILSLLVVVGCVLSAVAGFFVFLARKSASLPNGRLDAPDGLQLSSTKK